MAGRLSIRNVTDYPTDEARRLVRFAFEKIDTEARARTYVEIRPARRSVSGQASDTRVHGLYAREWRRLPRGRRYFVTVRLPAGGFPLAFGEHGIAVKLDDWRDALVWITAHEAKHVQRFRDYNERRPGYQGEAACDAFAAAELARYRNMNRLALDVAASA